MRPGDSRESGSRISAGRTRGCASGRAVEAARRAGGRPLVGFDADAGVLSAKTSSTMCVRRFHGSRRSAIHDTHRVSRRSSSTREPSHPPPKVCHFSQCKRPLHKTTKHERKVMNECKNSNSNDPSAGSPTETLLRLLHHLDDRVQPVSRQARRLATPLVSPGRPICRSDGRCVQRAGT